MGVIEHAVQADHFFPGLLAGGVQPFLIQGQGLMDQGGVFGDFKPLHLGLVPVQHVKPPFFVRVDGHGGHEKPRAGAVQILAAKVEQHPAVPCIFHDVAQLVHHEDGFFLAHRHVDGVLEAPVHRVHDVQAAHAQALYAFAAGGHGVYQAPFVHVQGGGGGGHVALEHVQLFLGIGEALELFSQGDFRAVGPEIAQKRAVGAELGNAVGVALADHIQAVRVVHGDFQGAERVFHPIQRRAGMGQGEKLAAAFDIEHQHLVFLGIAHVQLPIAGIQPRGGGEQLFISDHPDQLAVQGALDHPLVALVGNEQGVPVHEQIRRAL